MKLPIEKWNRISILVPIHIECIGLIQLVKPFFVERKAFQTSGSYVGTTTTTKLFSVFKTTIINNINVENNFNYIFENINKEPIDDLLPYS